MLKVIAQTKKYKKKYTIIITQEVANNTIFVIRASNKKIMFLVLNELAKEVSEELINFSSTKHYTLLKDSHEALKNFSWENMWLEMQEKSPILLFFFQKMLPKASKKLLCFLICMML